METTIGIFVAFLIFVSLFWKQILNAFLFVFVPKEIKLEGDVIDTEEIVNMFSNSFNQVDLTSGNFPCPGFCPITFYFIKMKYKDGTEHLIEVSQILFTEIKKQLSEKGSYYLSTLVQKYDWQIEPSCT